MLLLSASSRTRTATCGVGDAVLHLSGQAEQLGGTVEYARSLVEESSVLCHSSFEVGVHVSVGGY